MDRRSFVFGVTAALLAGAPALAVEPPPLDGPRQGPKRPPARFLMVLLHGFGADATDMIDVAVSLQDDAPSAAWAAPNAPYPIDSGFSWQPPGERNTGTAEERLARQAIGGGPLLDAFIASELARYALPPERLILVGFSQGASTALNTGLRRKVPPLAIVAFSGVGLAPMGLPQGVKFPPVLLIQGDEDPNVRSVQQQQTLKLLMSIGAPAEAHLLPGLGHTIDERGLRLAGELIRKVTQAAG